MSCHPACPTECRGERVIIGLLHPGQMGAAIASRLVHHGHSVLWHPEGRSAATEKRASEAGAQPVDDLRALLAEAEVVLSICPAAAAEEVAELVARHGYNGTYVDANAISPQRMRHIGALLVHAGAEVVDAVISGPPPKKSTAPRIYLAGPDKHTAPVHNLFASCAFSTTVLSESIGSASALKIDWAPIGGPPIMRVAVVSRTRWCTTARGMLRE